MMQGKKKDEGDMMQGERFEMIQYVAVGGHRERAVKYQIVEEKGLLLIKISGDTRKNEALLAKKVLFPYLKRKGIRVIVDLKELGRFELVSLLGVLSGIRKEVDFLRGDLKLCSLKPEILNYLKENRLDQIFQLYKDEEEARKGAWRSYAQG